MEKHERGGAGRSFAVGIIVLLILGLAGAVLYLLSDINYRRYRLATYESTLVVERGRMLPVGFKRFEPEAADLIAGYAPIPVPPGESYGRSEIFSDRADVDRALFALLAAWARDRLDSKQPGDFELGASYVRRCESLPGLSEEQRIELRNLRADLAFRTGRRLLGDVVTHLEKARDEFERAKKLGTSRPQDVDKWIADVNRRIRDYQNAYQPTDSRADETTPQSEPPAGAPDRTGAAEPEASGQPRWRL